MLQCCLAHPLSFYSLYGSFKPFSTAFLWGSSFAECSTRIWWVILSTLSSCAYWDYRQNYSWGAFHWAQVEVTLTGTQPIPQPHSLLLGHIPLMKSLRNGLPKDAHETYAQRQLIVDWKHYFPHATKCPPLIYLDIWPFLSQPLILVTSPEACYQLTQERPQPRHPMFQWALTPVTEGNDLISMDIQTHRLWRSRLNPGFSQRNLMSRIDEVMREITVFVQQLKTTTAKDVKGTWGKRFPLQDKIANLTFDVIMRTALSVKLHSQVSSEIVINHELQSLEISQSMNKHRAQDLSSRPYAS